MTEQLVGKEARVTAKVTKASCGEVMVNIRGGSEMYYAMATKNEEEFPVGAKVLIMDELPGRMVYVTQ